MLKSKGASRTLKDGRAHCYCASLLSTLFIGHALATSFSSARTESTKYIELMTYMYRPVQTVMIVDDSFNYHSLSLTIMFAIKRSMIVHDSLSKPPIRSVKRKNYHELSLTIMFAIKRSMIVHDSLSKSLIRSVKRKKNYHELSCRI